jgi:hypothetical protein
MFARVKDNIVASYPVDPRAEQTDTSFPWDWLGGVVNGVEYVWVCPVDVPKTALSQNVVEGTPVFENGVWVQSWVVSQSSPEDIATRQFEMRRHMSATPLQIRRALRRVGLLDSVTAFVSSASPEISEAWEYATRIERDDPLLIACAATLGVTDTEIDEIFFLAATL